MLIYIRDYFFDNISYCLCAIVFFAPDGSGKPGLKNLFFLGTKERPQEAPFMTLGKKVLREDLQRTAGLGSNDYF